MRKSPMKSGGRRKNSGTQEMAKVTDPATRYSESSARPRDAEQALHGVTREPNSLQNVQRHHIVQDSEFRHPWNLGAPQERGEAEEKRCKVPYSTSGPNGGNTRACCYLIVLSPERWQELSDSRCLDPRPKLVEFAYSRHMEKSLASSDRIKWSPEG